MTLEARVDDPRRWLGYVPKTLHRSPLYSHLYAGMEQDPEVAALMGYVDEDQPIPVLFFTGVNFLLLRDSSHELAQFYPYLNPSPRPAAEAYPYFRDFCLSHRDELRSVLAGARLQTNEVTRCSNLLPAFEIVSQRGGRRPLALIEMGASAGLNLNWSHYGYHYGQTVVGDAASPVQTHCVLEGNLLPPFPAQMPTFASCQGIELFPLDLHQEKTVRWLRACIWPEEAERYQLLDAAIQVAEHYPPQVSAGDACELLPALLKTIPADETLCLWHSYALNQGPKHVKESIEQTLLQASTTRTLYRISLEADPLREGLPRLELFTYQNGASSQPEWLANCALHGEKMEWLLPDR